MIPGWPCCCRDIHGLRVLLLQQGWDPATLLGKQGGARWRR